MITIEIVERLRKQGPLGTTRAQFDAMLDIVSTADHLTDALAEFPDQLPSGSAEWENTLCQSLERFIRT